MYSRSCSRYVWSSLYQIGTGCQLGVRRSLRGGRTVFIWAELRRSNVSNHIDPVRDQNAIWIQGAWLRMRYVQNLIVWGSSLKELHTPPEKYLPQKSFEFRWVIPWPHVYKNPNIYTILLTPTILGYGATSFEIKRVSKTYLYIRTRLHVWEISPLVRSMQYRLKIAHYWFNAPGRIHAECICKEIPIGQQCICQWYS